MDDRVYLYQGDCLEVMEGIPDKSVDLVLTDPPYNIGVTTIKNGKKSVNGWDRIPGYIDWCISWLLECQRLLKPSGVLYFFHNDMEQIAELLVEIRKRTGLVFVSFCIWDKGDNFRAKYWYNRDPEGATSLRSWFNVCEYCLHFFNAPREADAAWGKTGLERINSNPECYKPLKEWYAEEKERLGLNSKDIEAKYMEATGRGPGMLRHYFQNSQFEIPTRKVWDLVYEPLGFRIEYEGRGGYEALRTEYEALRTEYEALRTEYEALRTEYEALRNYHRCDKAHCNVWHVPPIPSTGRLHTCQKPESILERLCCVSCPPGG